MANEFYADHFYDNAARAQVSVALVNQKANVCPFAVRLAWHSSGTFDPNGIPTTGGSDGATMRFAPEITDDANAGLALMQTILRSVRETFPDLSIADLWTMAGTQAIKLCGGPDIPFRYGRTDAPDGSHCQPNGRLPDAAQGAQHLRDVFYRMGFDDRGIVALSGAHTLGSCHRSRSGFDGPWTSNPLKFDNEYYRNLLELDWRPREWDGPLQYQDPSGKLMMLPTDMALIQDERFLPIVKEYAADQNLFFHDFAIAFGALLAKGCPAHVQPDAELMGIPNSITPDQEFRDLAMHGSIERMKDVVINKGPIDANSTEMHSGRTALHKASFFGHAHVVIYLIIEHGTNPNALDSTGDTPLHDAARLGHLLVVQALLQGGADKTIRNKDGKTAVELAAANENIEVVQALM